MLIRVSNPSRLPPSYTYKGDNDGIFLNTYTERTMASGFDLFQQNVYHQQNWAL